MALGPKHTWFAEEVQSIREDKKTMTVTQLMEKYQLRRAQVCYALYYYTFLSDHPSESEGTRGRIKRLFGSPNKQ